MANKTTSDNIKTSWHNKTGETIQGFIKDQFDTIYQDLNNSIVNINFETDESDSSKINYSATRLNGQVISDNFTITPKSEKKVHLTKFEKADPGNYVKPGDNLNLKYGFKILDDSGSGIPGKKVTPQFIINGNTINGAQSGNSFSISERVENISISSTYLKEGKNSIQIKLLCKDEGKDLQQETNISDTIEILSFNINLRCSFDSSGSITDYKSLIDGNSNIKLKIQVTDDKGRDLVQNSEYSSNPPAIKYNIMGNDPNNNILGIDYKTNGTKDVTLNTLKGSNNSPVQYLCIQAYMNENAKSNVVKYQLILNENLSDDVYFVFKHNDVRDGSGDKVQTSNSNYIKETQYSNVNFEVYAYATTNSHLTRIINGDPIGEPIEIKANGSFTDVSWMYRITGTENLSYQLQSDGGMYVSFTVIPEIITDELTIPINSTLNLDANGVTNKWTEGVSYSPGFNNSSNGHINNALIINNNVSLTTLIKPFSSGLEKTITIRFKTNDDTYENEKLISCMSRGCDGFEIYPQYVNFYNGGKSITSRFTSENSIKEITIVWYGENKNKWSELFINGTSQFINTNTTRENHEEPIIFTSDNTSLYLYNILVYNRALNFQEIQNIYAIHSLDSDKIAQYAIDNAIFNSKVSLGENNGKKITIESLPVGSKYILIKAHPLGQNKPWECINKLEAYINKKETKSFRLLAGETYLITKVAKGQDPDPFNFYANRITLSGQGTSSMEYPVKNFRIYFNKSITSASKAQNASGFGDCYEGYLSNNNNWSNTQPSGESIHYTEGNFGKTTKFVVGSSVIDHTKVPSGSESSSKKYYKMRTDAFPADLFCFKADYAESSGIHNTGFARMANYVLENSVNICPSVEKTIEGEYDQSKLPQNGCKEHSTIYKVRSTIDGFPIYLFFEDHDGNIIYHGKYNFNNEKATETIFGFSPLKDDPGYFDNNIVKNELNHLKEVFNLTTSNKDLEKTHATYKDSNKIPHGNPIECWEFSTNNPTFITGGDLLGDVYKQIGAFCYPYTDESDINYDAALYPFSKSYLGKNVTTYENKNPFSAKAVIKGEEKMAWINSEQAWEYRFPDLSDYEDKTNTKKDDFGDIQNQKQFAGHNAYEDGTIQPYLLKSLYKWVHRHNVYLWNKTNQLSKVNDNIKEFAENLHLYFNINYLLKYYVLTKWFINADQRIKNCMIAFYCDPYADDNKGNTTATKGSPMGHMRAYYIFYDNDTILGVNNTGGLTINWNAGETKDVYPGIDSNNIPYHGIWANLEYCYDAYINGKSGVDNSVLNLGKMICDTYQYLRRVLTDGKIDFFLDGLDPDKTFTAIGINKFLPDSANNVDVDIKYLYPDDLRYGNDPVPDGLSENLNDSTINGKYQGNRKYHREWIIRKRTNWFDSLYGGGNIIDYKIGFKVSGEINCNDIIKLTSNNNNWRFYYKESDAGVLNPINLQGSSIKTLIQKNEIASYSFGNLSPSFSYYICALNGASKIDMSGFYGNTKETYFRDINIEKSLNYTTEFILGNILGDLYINDINSLGGQTVNKHLFPNLKSLKLINCKSNTLDGSFGNLNLEGKIDLEELDLTGTVCSSITMPKGDKLSKITLEEIRSLILEDKLSLTSNNLIINNIITEGENSELLLTNINLKNCNTELYKWALEQNTVDSRGNKIKIDITIGNKTSQNIDNIIPYLYNLSLKDPSEISHITIVGKGSYSNVEYNGQINSIRDTFPELEISNNTGSTELGVSVSGASILQEGNSIIVQANLFDVYNESGVYKWDLVNTTGAPITITNKKRGTCTINAVKSENNNSYFGNVEVKGYYSETEYYSVLVPIQYIGISEIELTTDRQITTDYSIIKINTYGNISGSSRRPTTKDYLFEIENGNWKYSNLISMSGINCDDKELTNSSITLDNGIKFEFNNEIKKDCTISITLIGSPSITSKINIYYDEELEGSKNLTEVTQNYPWIAQLLAGQLGRYENNNLRRSILNNFQIDSQNGTLICYYSGTECGRISTDNESQQNPNYDLSRLNYFGSKHSDTFEIPYNFTFTNISIPKGFTSVKWTTISNSASRANYGKFIFPNTVQKVVVNLELTIYFPDLQFDISNTKIDKIYSVKPSDNNNYYFQLYLKVPENTTPPNEANPKTLFIYNDAINYKEIGTYLELGTANGMFEVTTTENTYSPFYLFGNVPNQNNDLYIGKIANYEMTQSCFEWSSIASRVKGMSETFTGTKDCPQQDITFTNLEYIGDKTFKNSGVNGITYYFPKCSDITSIGSEAFSNFKGILAKSPIVSQLEFNNLNVINYKVFANMDHSLNAKFYNIKTFSDMAFNNNNSNVLHNITIIYNKSVSVGGLSTTYTPFYNTAYIILNVSSSYVSLFEPLFVNNPGNLKSIA